MNILGLGKLKQTLKGFDDNLAKLEKEKEALRSNKIKIEQAVKGKDVKNISIHQVKECLNGLRGIEAELDKLIQDENDILNIDRQK